MDTKADVIRVEILDGGLLRVTTDPISAPNHVGAEQLLGAIARKLGGQTDTQKRGHSHGHSHSHEHSHEHHTH